MNSPSIGVTMPPPTYTAGSRRTVLVMLGLVSMFNYIDRTVLSVLQEPIKSELGLSDGQLGLLTGLPLPCSTPPCRFPSRAGRTASIAATSSPHPSRPGAG